ncbi:MAG: zinc-dependent peptidase [Balneolaceae bacterium]|nr:zinc-dependent peptidase [Balneolaceae bacterium]
MPLLQYLRRLWISRRPFPARWLRILEKKMPVYRNLSEETRKKLHNRMQIFLYEKIFEGCGGFSMGEENKVIIAAHACMLILEEPSGYYPSLKSILIYPADYVAPVYEQDAGGVVTEGWESRSGESWNPGNIVLSWKDISHDLEHPSDGNNLIYHEFMHQLDYQYGLSSGIEDNGQTDSEDEWTRELARTYRSLLKKAQRGEEDLLDLYGATAPAECLAVATECFLEQPEAVQQRYPDLYRHLASFFGYDPVTLFRV